MKTSRILVARRSCSPWLLAGPAFADDAAFNAELLSIQQAWAKVNYETPAGDARAQAFEALEKRAEKFTQQNPGSRRGADLGRHRREQLRRREGRPRRAQPGQGSARQPRGGAQDQPEGARRLGLHQPRHAVLQGARLPGRASAITTRPASCSRRRSTLNPNGIDPNYFYGEFLFEQGQYGEALKYLDKAATAAPRPGRESADKGRHAEIDALTAKVKAKMG